MINVIKIEPVGFASNSYLVTADGKNAVAIDPAQPRVLEEAVRRGLKIKYVLLTHGHFDHIGGCAALRCDGAKIGCLEEERETALGKNNLVFFRATRSFAEISAERTCPREARAI